MAIEVSFHFKAGLVGARLDFPNTHSQSCCENLFCRRSKTELNKAVIEERAMAHHRLPNEAKVFIRKGIVRRQYLVSFDALDQPLGIMTEHFDVSDHVELVHASSNICYTPDTFASTNGGLSLNKVNLMISHERVETIDGATLYASIAVEFWLMRNKRKLQDALEKGVFKTFATDFANRIKASISNAIGRVTLETALQEQRDIAETSTIQMHEEISRTLAVHVERINLRLFRDVFDVIGPAGDDNGSKPFDAPSELRRFLRVFEERGVHLNADQTHRLALAINDRQKIDLLSKSSSPLVLLPAEAAGMVSADLMELKKPLLARSPAIESNTPSQESPLVIGSDFREAGAA